MQEGFSMFEGNDNRPTKAGLPSTPRPADAHGLGFDIEEAVRAEAELLKKSARKQGRVRYTLHLDIPYIQLIHRFYSSLDL